MGYLNLLFGTYRLKITSADPNTLLEQIIGKGIVLHNIQYPDMLTIQADIASGDINELQRIAAKRGEKISILSRRGIWWSIKSLIHRPLLVGGMILLMFLSLYLPTRVLFVHVEGNQSVSTRQIIDNAAACGIGFGASRRNVRSEHVKNALLSAIPELKWVGVNTTGCVAVVSVREREIPSASEMPNVVSSIVAARDGVISEITVLRGNAMCKTGQAVKKGQVLVSGYTDCGISVRAERADAEIFAKTTHAIQTISPVICNKRESITQIKTHYMLCIGKKLINLQKDSGIFDTSCVKMYEKIPLSLPGGFTLPIYLIQVTVKYYNTTQAVLDEAVENSLYAQADNYLLDQMISGQILSCGRSVTKKDDAYIVNYRYACVEMIGTVRYEEMITQHE